MLLLKSTTHNPYFNIATEEFLLKNFDEDIIFLYKNTPSVIIGKHQIHNLEVNIPYTYKNNIPIIRRISGGGSVFHDENNLNYSIISSSEKAWVDFEKFTSPFIHYLSSLHLSPELRSKSDIRLHNKKISGNASHIFKNKTMHHGSILFATDLNTLTETLKNSPSKYLGKSVNSRRSLVTNIASLLKKTIDITEFEEQFILSLYKNHLLTKEMHLTEEMKIQIEELANTKYKKPEWNIYYNANYQFENQFLYREELCQVRLEIQKGICKTVTIKHHLLKDLQHLIQNVPHETNAFIQKLQAYLRKEDILNHFF